MAARAKPLSLMEALVVAGIADLAGYRAHGRGMAYFAEGRVVGRELTEYRVEATVRGTLPYRVSVASSVDGLEWECTCPVGDDGEFCKHAVAVALSVLTDPNIDPSTTIEPTGLAGRTNLRAFVAAMSHDDLVELVIDQADKDRRLRDYLTALAASAAGTMIDTAGWRQRIDTAFEPYDSFVDYREVAGWSESIGQVIDSLSELIDAGHAAAVVDLAEHAYRRVLNAMDYVHDDNGDLSWIAERIGELHQAAVTDASPEPVALAQRLLELELADEYGQFHHAAAAYADELGDDGLAEYRRLITPLWEALAATDRRTTSWSSDYRIREAMIGVALAANDPDDLIAIKQRDLKSADDYRQIALILRDNGRPDEAIGWCRRGLDDTSLRGHHAGPLRDTYAELLRARNDEAGAVAEYRNAFVRWPSLDHYRRWITEASATVAEAEITDDANRVLRQLVADTATRSPDRGEMSSREAVEVLVELLLYQGDVDAAWNVSAEHGVPKRLAMTLARAREATHPLDVIPIYQAAITTQIDTKKNPGYAAAVDLMARIKSIAERVDDPAIFLDLLAEIRTVHKPKRNLMTLLADRRW